MSRLLLPNRFCASCALLAVRESPLLSLRGGARVKQQLSGKRIVFNQQQRRYAEGSNTASSKCRSKSRIWICGLGVGIALAVGLKYRTDTTGNSCDDNIHVEVKRTDRYSAAVKVSRDLVERIKVGTEVGLFLLSFWLTPFPLRS